MSSIEALEILKNWHKASTSLELKFMRITPVPRWGGPHVQIRSIHASVLLLGDASGKTESRSLDGATFAGTIDPPILQILFRDKTSLILSEPLLDEEEDEPTSQDQV